MPELRAHPPHFLDLLKEVFDDEDKAITPLQELRHNPSSASFMRANGTVTGACLRQLYYKAMGEKVSDPKDLTVKLQALFGQAIHDALTAKWMKSNKIKLVPESKGQAHVDELTQVISYRLDGLVNYRGEPGVLEIKTQQSFGLTYMLKEGGPKDSDILQVLTYLEANKDLMWAVLVYFGRDNAYRAEFHIWKDPKTNEYMIEGVTPKSQPKPIRELKFEGVRRRWKLLEGYVARKEMPPRDYKAVLSKEGKVVDKRTKNGVDYKTDFRCRYCSYQTTCWSLPDAKEESIKIGEIHEIVRQP